MDLLGEVTDLVNIREGCCISESEFLREAWVEGLEGCERIPFLSPARRALFEKYARLFAEKVQKAGVSVIVVKNFLCEKHGGCYDEFLEYPQPSLPHSPGGKETFQKFFLFRLILRDKNDSVKLIQSRLQPPCKIRLQACPNLVGILRQSAGKDGRWTDSCMKK